VNSKHLLARSSAGCAPGPELYAEAVHRAVCESTGDDGFGHCPLYICAGSYLLSALAPELGVCMCRSGSLLLSPNPRRPGSWVGLDIKNGGIARGAFHCWLSFPSGLVVDFSARHYVRYTTEAGGRWDRPKPPAVIWSSMRDLPRWISFKEDLAASEEFHRRIQAGKGNVYYPLGRLAYRHFERMNAEATRPSAASPGASR
jgi:hypothetical protein